jgi:hypothetical protein
MFQVVDIEDSSNSEGQINSCRTLWAHVLAMYLDDALKYAAGAKLPHPCTEEQAAAAYRDLTGEGAMLEHICEKLPEVTPEYVRLLVRDRLNAAQGDRKNSLAR